MIDCDSLLLFKRIENIKDPYTEFILNSHVAYLLLIDDLAKQGITFNKEYVFSEIDKATKNFKEKI